MPVLARFRSGDLSGFVLGAEFSTRCAYKHNEADGFLRGWFE
jgi:hypothetical protein